MSVQIIHDRQQDVAVMYCTTSMFAFGPIFHDEKGKDAEERIRAFFRWLDAYAPEADDLNYIGSRYFHRDHDPRGLTDAGLERAYLAWLAQEEQQYANEEQAAADARRREIEELEREST